MAKGNYYTQFRNRTATARRSTTLRRAPAGASVRPSFRSRTMAAVSRKAKAKTVTKLGFALKKKNPMRRLVVPPAVGGAPSFSQFVSVHPPSPQVRTIKKVAAPNYYTTNSSSYLSVQEGFQNAADWHFIDKPDLVQMISQSPGTSIARRMVLENCSAEYLITNSGLATMFVDVYDIATKKSSYDIDTSSPVQAWTVGLNHETAGGTSTEFQMIGSLPTDSLLFKDWFKVIKRRHFALSPGSTHRHHLVLKPNRLIDQEEMSHTANYSFPGLTFHTMIVAYGQPTSIEGGSQVTTATGKLDIVTARRYKFTYVVDNQVNNYLIDNLYSSAGASGERVIPLNTAQIIANAVA